MYSRSSAEAVNQGFAFFSFWFNVMLVADHHLDDIKGRIMAVRRVSGLLFLALMFNQESGIRVVNKKSISDE